MKIIVCDNTKQMGLLAAIEIREQIKAKNDSVMILPTGSTPISMYEETVRMYNAGELSFASVKTFNLDEYIGIEEDHVERYYNFMMRNLFSKVDIKPENINIPSSKTTSPENECKLYEDKYRLSGGADIAFLGIGQNGHIGFNEPGTPFDSVTHVTPITESTIKANARFFASEELVPKSAMTMGISTIMSAKKIVLLISGKSKRDILKKLLEAKEPTESIPASVLLNHPNTVIYCDREAAEEI